MERKCGVISDMKLCICLQIYCIEWLISRFVGNLQNIFFCFEKKVDRYIAVATDRACM